MNLACGLQQNCDNNVPPLFLGGVGGVRKLFASNVVFIGSLHAVGFI